MDGAHGGPRPGATRAFGLALALALAGCAAGGDSENGGGGAAQGAPSPPEDLAYSIEASTVVLTWSEVPGALRYNLYWDDEPGVDPATDAVFADVESPLSQALPFTGATFHLVVTAVDANGESQPSNEVAVLLEGPPLAPTGLSAVAGDSAVELTWTGGLGAASHTLHWGEGTASGASPEQVVAGVSSPFTLPGLTNGTPYWFSLVAENEYGTSGPSDEVSATPGSDGLGTYAPDWAVGAVLEDVVIEYDPGKTTQENGDLLEDAMEGLAAGERLLIGAGTWTVNPKIALNLVGTPSAPIFIEAAPGADVHITRDDQSQNTINIGEGSPARYLALRNLEITWGDTAVRMYDCQHVWIDSCHIHDFGGGGITANANDTDGIYITRNEIHGGGNIGEGEGMYLGANNGARIMTNSVIAQNHVYGTGGSQGDGIELKQGSYGNLIVENLVHDTPYPCILVYGTGGMEPFNRIERNVVYNSGDNVIQIQGEAVVSDNLAVNGANALFSNDHQGTSRDLTVVHNTFVNTGTAVNLSDWNGRPGMVFANNVAYSKTSYGLRLNGSTGVELSGNVIFGATQSVPGGTYVTGTGLGDFVDLTWTASALDATPAPGSPIAGAGDPDHMTLVDLDGQVRELPADAGCLEAD